MISRSNSPAQIDILILCALKNEFDQLLKVTEGITDETWQTGNVDNGRSVADVRIKAKNGQILNIRATWNAYMGREQAQAVTSTLLKEKPVKLLAMSGICAGWRGKVQYGDVILADRLWSYDSGKIRNADGVENFKADPIQYRPPEIWVQHMQSVKISEKANWLSQRPPLSTSLDSPDETPFQIHVAPMACGAAVIEDENIFFRLEQSNRKVLGLDMEASALAALAEANNIPFIVAKGVVDFADHSKDDRFHDFGARASAEVLLELFRNAAHLLETSPSHAKNNVRVHNEAGYSTEISADFRKLINELADLYPGVMEARSLWERAGGRSRDVENLSRPLDLWQLLWKRSLQGATVSPRSLLTAALEDFPKNEFFREYLQILSQS